jgi:hypothetical protein
MSGIIVDGVVPIEALKNIKKLSCVAVKTVVKRGGSWQVTVPEEMVNLYNLKEHKLLFVELESEKGKFFILLPNTRFLQI